MSYALRCGCGGMKSIGPHDLVSLIRRSCGPREQPGFRLLAESLALCAASGKMLDRMRRVSVRKFVPVLRVKPFCPFASVVSIRLRRLLRLADKIEQCLVIAVRLHSRRLRHHVCRAAARAPKPPRKPRLARFRSPSRRMHPALHRRAAFSARLALFGDLVVFHGQEKESRFAYRHGRLPAPR